MVTFIDASLKAAWQSCEAAYCGFVEAVLVCCEFIVAACDAVDQRQKSDCLSDLLTVHLRDIGVLRRRRSMPRVRLFS